MMMMMMMPLCCNGIDLKELDCGREIWEMPEKYNTSSEINPNAKLNVHLIPHSHDDPGQ